MCNNMDTSIAESTSKAPIAKQLGKGGSLHHTGIFLA